MNHFGEVVELVKTLLGATSCRIRKGADTVSAALSVIVAAKCSLDSVVLIIDRPTPIQYTRQKSGSRNHVARVSAPQGLHNEVPVLEHHPLPQNWRINQNPPSRSPVNHMQQVNFETNNWGHNVAYNPTYPSTAPIRGSPPIHQTTDATNHYTNTSAIPQQVSAERPSQPQANNSSLQNLRFLINATYNQREELTEGHL